jgi:hypothetical protein
LVRLTHGSPGAYAVSLKLRLRRAYIVAGLASGDHTIWIVLLWAIMISLSALGLLAACEDRQNMRYRGTRAFRPGSLFISLTREELCDARQADRNSPRTEFIPASARTQFLEKMSRKGDEVGRRVASGDRTTAIVHFSLGTIGPTNKPPHRYAVTDPHYGLAVPIPQCWPATFAGPEIGYLHPGLPLRLWGVVGEPSP